jgi:PIN domain nuclease of toxin-antitoxin system
VIGRVTAEHILDASALIALLKAEPGAEMVAAAIGDARMSTVNLAEVVSHFAHLGMPAAAIDAMLGPLPVVLVPADAALARTAGQLRALTASAGLSLGDRFCLALARLEGRPAWTADRAWLDVADAVGVEVRLIR